MTAIEYFQSIIMLHKTLSHSFEYSPKVDLFFKCGKEVALINMAFNLAIYANDRIKQHNYITALFTSLVHSIRAGLGSAEFKRKEYDLDNKSSRNFHSAVNYVKCLFARNSRLLVLRIDFSYLQNYTKNIGLKAAKTDFTNFLNNVRGNKKLSSELEGYIWKIESGPLKGIHFHCLFFYGVTTTCHAEYWATQLGMCWRKTTENHGEYANKNASTTDFDERGYHGVGIISRHDKDQEKRDVLLNLIVRYLVSVDQYLMGV